MGVVNYGENPELAPKQTSFEEMENSQESDEDNGE